MECSAQNSGTTVRSVFSSATALAPFSQNSAALRFVTDSGQAQPGQSKPPRWFSRSRDWAVRVDAGLVDAAFQCHHHGLESGGSLLGFLDLQGAFVNVIHRCRASHAPNVSRLTRNSRQP